VSLPVRYLEAARDELPEAVEWHENQRPGKGEALLAEVERVVGLLADFPRMHAVVYRDVRKAVVRGFPYIVLTREDSGELLIVSVFHTSRDPAEWKGRV